MKAIKHWVAMKCLWIAWHWLDLDTGRYHSTFMDDGAQFCDVRFEIPKEQMWD